MVSSLADAIVCALPEVAQESTLGGSIPCILHSRWRTLVDSLKVLTSPNSNNNLFPSEGPVAPN